MPRSKLRILILNWRDIQNPSSGGAEVLTHEIAKRWVKSGNEVTQVSAFFKNAKKEEVIDGVKIIRMGNSDVRYIFNSIHFLAFLHYQKYFKGKFDVVIDEIHGIPFFTPLYIKEKKIALICEVAGKIWDTNFPFPFDVFGKLAEKIYFRFYKKVPFLTISPSTQRDLIESGIAEKNITILPMGITVPSNLPKFEKEKDPTLIFVGRLLRAKGIEDAIEVYARVRKEFPRAKLWIVGRGEKSYEEKIKQLVKNLGIEKQVLFLGFLSQEKKFEMMGRAHILLAPSVKEGFGLTVPEAGIVGTPAIAYNVEGLKDIIKDGENGFLVDPNSYMMERKVRELLTQKNLYKSIQEETIKYAKKLDWKNTARIALSAITS